MVAADGGRRIRSYDAEVEGIGTDFENGRVGKGRFHAWFAVERRQGGVGKVRVIGVDGKLIVHKRLVDGISIRLVSREV